MRDEKKFRYVVIGFIICFFILIAGSVVASVLDNDYDDDRYEQDDDYDRYDEDDDEEEGDDD